MMKDLKNWKIVEEKMKEFKCDGCKKKVEEENLYGEEYEVSDTLEALSDGTSFSLGEVVYDGSSGELCKDCIKKLFIKEIEKKIKDFNGEFS
jgi:DNA-directed RNA polymerase subunit RPC12/RpoP